MSSIVAPNLRTTPPGPVTSPMDHILLPLIFVVVLVWRPATCISKTSTMVTSARTDTETRSRQTIVNFFIIVSAGNIHDYPAGHSASSIMVTSRPWDWRLRCHSRPRFHESLPTGLDGFLKFAGLVAGQAPVGAVERCAAFLGKAVDIARRVMQPFRRQGLPLLDDQFKLAHVTQIPADFATRGKRRSLSSAPLSRRSLREAVSTSSPVPFLISCFPDSSLSL